MFKTITTEEVLKPVVQVTKTYECDKCEFKTGSFYDIKQHSKKHTYSNTMDLECFVEDLEYLDFNHIYLFDSEEKAKEFAQIDCLRLDWAQPGWYLVKRHYCGDHTHDCVNELIPLYQVIFEHEEFLNNMKKIAECK